MKKRSITLIIWLMSVALVGVMAMQYYFIRESFKQKSQLFDEAVTAALASVASKIEKREIYEFVREQDRINQEKFKADQAMREHNEQLLASQLDIQEKIKKLQRQQFDYQQRYKEAEENLKALVPNAIFVDNVFYETYIRRKRYQSYIDFNVIKYIGEGYFDTDIQLTATREVPLIPAKDDSTRFIIPYFRNNQVEAMQTATLIPRMNKDIADQLQELERELVLLNAKKLRQATTLFDTLAIIGGKREGILKDVESSMQLAKKPFRERLNYMYLKRELDAELNKRDIYVPFNIEVRDDQSYIIYETLRSTRPAKKNQQFVKYSTKLFENDLNSAPGLLSIYFPNKSSIIRDTMSYMLLPMIALLALLIGAFAYTLSIIFKQKKISEMKTDFMNNMTHEFKTPVATIMIASESLRDEEIAADSKRVNRLANIIYDENVRLGSHIERVLNIARLEKENLKIEKVDVYINAVVSGVLDSMALQLHRVNGTLHTDISASNDLVVGDELHLSNVFFNLLDNAIKYSKSSPDISIKTRSTERSITVTIADRGIGMTKDQKEKIFDQFYRIPTGNIHNVKGFGLGLSYVNDIVKRLNGKIQVKSEKDKGTVFELTFPLKGSVPDREE